MPKTVNIPSQIVIQTAAQWAVDATVYSAKRILVTSDVFYGSTDQRKYKIADGTQTWSQLDYFPVSGYDDATSSIQTQINNKQPSLGFTPEDVANKDVDGAFTANSDTKYPSQKAAKTYIDNAVAGATIADATPTLKGKAKLYSDVTGNNTDGAPDQNSVKVALATKEDVGNKDIDGTLAANSDIKYASQKATKTYADSVSSNASVISKVLTAFSSGAGTVTSSDSILTAFQKVVGNIALKLTANTPITGATKTKITYDANGLVTSGADATTADIADSTNKRYVTDAQQTVIGNTSGTNSGNETASTIGSLLNGSGSATPNDTDLVATAESSVLKKITWTNVKSFLKTYFDTLYQGASLALLKANNLSDLNNIATAITNLGLSSATSLNQGAFGITYDGMGGVITTNNYSSVIVPYAGTITSWRITSIDPTAGTALSGSIVIDIKRGGTSIIGGGNKPTLTSASSANAAVSSWTSVAVAVNDELDFYVVSATTVLKVQVIIKITKT